MGIFFSTNIRTPNIQYKVAYEKAQKELRAVEQAYKFNEQAYNNNGKFNRIG